MPDDKLKPILVIDDIRANRDLMAALFEAEDVALVMASDGEQALALTNKSPPDLILLDIMIPGMNGFDVIWQLKSHTRTAGIPVIMVSSLSDHESRNRALEAGAAEMLSKPLSREKLLPRVMSLLKLPGSG